MATLLTPLLEQEAVRSVNFFNGRLLSAEDLSKEQLANLERRNQLGRVIGDGIAYGFEVTQAKDVSKADSPAVTIQPGLAVNRKGQTLALTQETNLSLVRPLATEVTEAGTFADCKPPDLEATIVGGGVYLLVVCPATAKEGRAPVSGQGSLPASCGTKYTVDCVQFRLIKVDVPDVDLTAKNVRNVLAYKCFGVTDAAYTDYISDPFGTHDGKYGLLDGLRPDTLTDCDVPLALILWTSDGSMGFIDMWSVRRRIAPSTTGDGWLTVAGARRMSEGEAMVMQFQDQISEIVKKEDAPYLISAGTYFAYLPPIGCLPLYGGIRTQGLNPLKFFDGQKVTSAFSTFGQATPANRHAIRDGIYVEDALVPDLFHEAYRYPPIDVKSDEVLWLYVVRQNMQSIEEKKASVPRPLALFVNGHVPYVGNARFDLAYYDYGNYA